jgi:hypothetical protein
MQDLFNSDLFYHLFFQKDLRSRRPFEEGTAIQALIPRLYKDIYETHSDKMLSKVNSPNEHNFFKLFLNRSNQSQENSCDCIFFKYLEFISGKTNKEYLSFVFKFIVLFRECLNRYKNVELENTLDVFEEILPTHIKEFTQFYDAEQVPELCNEFISEYLISNDYFGMSYEYITEFIEITQHFCYWLYENNYTSSKLSIYSLI